MRHSVETVLCEDCHFFIINEENKDYSWCNHHNIVVEPKEFCAWGIEDEEEIPFYDPRDDFADEEYHRRKETGGVQIED